MRFETASSPHTALDTSVGQVMRRVLYALVPGLLLMLGLFGWGFVTNLLLCALVVLAGEAAMLLARGRPLKPALTDYSALVTATLLALALPPLAPWWLVVVAGLFAIVVAKHLYGGLGYNPFNPAMVGYVVVLVAFPVEMTSWPLPGDLLGLGDTLAAVFAGGAADGVTGATVLDTVKTELALARTLDEIRSEPVFGLIAGEGWEWVGLAWLVGGLWLLKQRVIYWQIPVGMLGSLFVMAAVFWAVDPEHYASPMFHLFAGASLLGAFFIATDPVSAATTPRGRLYFGIGIGVLVYVIRTWGGYPDGVAFAVLLMNLAAPTLDLYTKPRVYGHHRGEDQEPESGA